MKKEHLYIIEDYVRSLEKNLAIIKDHLSVLELDWRQKELAEETIQILEKKIKLMKKARTKKDLKEVLKIKKLVEGEE